MPAHKLSAAQCREALAALDACGGNQALAARTLGIDRNTFSHRVQRARQIFGADGAASPPPPPAAPSRDVELEALRRQLRAAQAAESLHEWARQVIHGVDARARDAKAATWLRDRQRTPAQAGIPTLLLSDLHWGEVVRAEEIGGVNSYDLATARRRLQTVIEKTIVLLRDHVRGDYPGLVLALGGDLISGCIHDELEQTNDGTVIEQLIDLFEHMGAAIRALLDEFGRLYIACVPGNHGRQNRKWQAKRKTALSYEWLLYQFLMRTFADDDRISWNVPSGPDADWEMCGTRYRLTHGDSFKGGDGIIGPIGPVTRGTLKRGQMAAAMGQPFDILCMGHWHTLRWGQRWIMNGSLIGFNEFAMSFNADPEPPQQALWLTAPGKGVTIQMPVFA